MAAKVEKEKLAAQVWRAGKCRLVESAGCCLETACGSLALGARPFWPSPERARRSPGSPGDPGKNRLNEGCLNHFCRRLFGWFDGLLCEIQSFLGPLKAVVWFWNHSF